jgi:hypothetical protein
VRVLSINSEKLSKSVQEISAGNQRTKSCPMIV